ncbi:MAG: Mur ligase family protein [Bdellovibrionales bacterium]
MTIIETAIVTIVFFIYVAFAAKRLMTYMHVLQQEDYANGRLWQWMGKNQAFDKRVSMALLLLGALIVGVDTTGYSFLLPAFFLNFLTFIIFTMGAYLEKDPRKNSKKKLVATARAKRIFFPALVICIAMGIPSFYFSHPWPWIVVVQMIPFVLMMVNLALQPFEDIVQAGYWREAHEKLNEINPKVIAITGSYGKTSVKHILGHILSTQAPILMTPGSVNTPMGVTRVIREQLEPIHEYLIVEMGAYGPGSIKRLCDLTPPDFGIITAIGHAHYERFKSLDIVAKTKYELAEAVLKKGGKTVVHEKTLRFNYARQIKNEYPEHFVVCGDAPNVSPQASREVSFIQADDLQIHNIVQKPSTLEVKFAYKNKVYTPEAPIFGLHHAHNIVLAFAICVELGISTDAIQDALRSLPQIRHRLEVLKQPDGTTLIDDAYNSNPIGFQSALGILEALGKTGRKILITPGMIELGVAHDEVHQKIGQSAGEVCDVCIVVSPKRIPTFISGFKSGGAGKQLIEVDSFAEAQSWFVKNKLPGDVLLIENDLPDMYERVPKM